MQSVVFLMLGLLAVAVVLVLTQYHLITDTPHPSKVSAKSVGFLGVVLGVFALLALLLMFNPDIGYFLKEADVRAAS